MQKKDRVSIFVDAANMFFTQKKNEWNIDYDRVRRYCEKFGDITGSYYYTATPSYTDSSTFEKYRKYRSALINLGYNVIDKEIKKITTDKITGKIITKGNLDIELVMGMISNMKNYDIAILLGGDSDFVPLLKYLRDNGKTIICIGRRDFASEDLLNAINLFINICDLKKELEKTLKRGH
jgi:uncharacterized LabA/DUF88 family protein